MGGKTVGRIFDETFMHYGNRFKAFFITVLVFYGFSLVWGLLSRYLVSLLGMDAASLQMFFVSTRSFMGYMLLSLLSMVLLFLFDLPSALFGINAYDVMIQIAKGDKTTVRAVMQKFSRNWWRYLGISVWSSLWVFLWSFVFIIPGFVKAFSYLLAPYLILEYPQMTVRQALKKSIEITNGFKGRLFGLAILAALPVIILLIICSILFGRDAIQWFNQPFGILALLANLFWIKPVSYMMYTIAYLDIKQFHIGYGQLPPENEPPAPVSGGPTTAM